MIALIVFMSLLTGTIHKYLEVRVRLAEARGSGGVRGVAAGGGGGDGGVPGGIKELGKEFPPVRQQETEAVLGCASRLQTLAARVKHLEAQPLGEGAGERTPLAAGATRPPVEAR